jgi:hypothetical protein
MGRFADPLHDKNKTVPGPGYYSPDSILTMGQDSMCVPQRARGPADSHTMDMTLTTLPYSHVWRILYWV